MLRAADDADPGPPDGPPSDSVTSRLRLAALALLGAGSGCVLALHVLRTDLSPVGDRLSEYANGSSGEVMTAAFFALGAGTAVLGVALMGSGATGRWSRAVPLALIAAGIGLVVSGVFPTDPLGASTTAEMIHSQASGLATVAVAAAAFCWSVLRPRRRLGADGVIAIIGAVLALVSPALHESSWTGLSQRLLWLTLASWLLLTSWRSDRRAP